MADPAVQLLISRVLGQASELERDEFTFSATDAELPLHVEVS